MSVKGLGRCGLCHRQIDEATPVNTVMLGRPARAYMCHKDCKQNEPPRIDYTPDGRGVLAPPHGTPEPSDTVLVTTPPDVQDQLNDHLRTISKQTESMPTMPVKEQVGRRRGR